MSSDWAAAAAMTQQQNLPAGSRHASIFNSQGVQCTVYVRAASRVWQLRSWQLGGGPAAAHSSGLYSQRAQCFATRSSSCYYNKLTQLG